MYLSRVELDMKKRETIRAFAQLSRFHGAVETAFKDGRKRRLWRLDALAGKKYILLLSEDKPELDHIRKQFGIEDKETSCVTKDYTPWLDKIQENRSYHFRLVANPTYSEAIENGRGKVKAHVVPRYQEQWLLRQAEKNGFRADEIGILESQWKTFHKKSGNIVSILSVTFEGSLTVTDREKFIAALTEGIGRGKAYGMGMLTVI